MRSLALPTTIALTLLVASLFSVRAAFPPVDKLPARPELPDPLVMLDGERITTRAAWESNRRPELKALFQHYMYGTIPPALVKVSGKVSHEDTKAFGGKATLREVTLTVGPPKAPKVHLLLVIPNAVKGRVPVFVGMNFSGNHALVNDAAVRVPTAWMYPGPGVKNNKATAAGRGKQIDTWAIEQSIDRGYAVATFYGGDIDPDQRDVRGGIRPYLNPKGDTATIAAWAWGIQRVVDYLVTLKEIDSKKIAVVGHSRLGKTALLAAAFDERIALAIPHQAGCGGTAPSRDKVGGDGKRVETVALINKNFPHWFNANFKAFNDKVERLPFDQHCLVALVAPRPVLFSNAAEDVWANPDGQFEVLKAADPVYRLLGAGGLATKEKPAVNVLSSGTLGYYIRPGKHSMTKGDWKVFLDFADKHLRKSAKRARSAAPGRKLLLVGQGADGHPVNTHEYMAGLRVLAHCLKKVGGVDVTTVRADGAWKEGPELIDRSDAVVLFLAEGARWMDIEPKRKAALKRLAKRGGGLVVLHWAMGTREAKHVPNCLKLLGGCHGGPDRKYKVLTAQAKVAAHPLTAGIKDFRVKEEWYYRLKFTEETGVVPLLRVTIDGHEETVAWAWQRPAGGRSFGFSGLHFHDNWKLPEYRRLVTQATVWALELPVPEGGLGVEVGAEALKRE